MQETLNFPSPIPTSPKSLTRFLTISRPKTAHFPSLSSQTTPTTTTTINPPLKPTTLPKQPNPLLLNDIPTTPLPQTNSQSPWDPHQDQVVDLEFQEKALYLDSLGIDCLTSLPPSAIANSASLSDLQSLFDYLTTTLNFPSSDLRRVISMCPQVLTLSFKDTAKVFTFLLREAQVPTSSLRYAIRRRPRLLVSCVETRLRPTMYFLQSIGIHETHKHTDLLSCSVEERLLPKMQYFEKVGFAYRDVVGMFRKFPALFCYSVRDNFEPKFNYFVVEMGRDLKELREFPQYFSFSLERRIKVRHQSCVESGVCFPLSVLLKMKEEQFRARLDACCNSSMPRSTSPLFFVRNDDS